MHVFSGTLDCSRVALLQFDFVDRDTFKEDRDALL